MASYLELAAFKELVVTPPSLEGDLDELYQSWLDAATSAIDIKCKRDFFTQTHAAKFNAPDSSVLVLPDLLSDVPTVTLYGSPFTAFRLIGDRQWGIPNHWSMMQRVESGRAVQWDSEVVDDPDTVGRIEAIQFGADTVWGYSLEIPQAVVQVCQTLALRLFEISSHLGSERGGNDFIGNTIVPRSLWTTDLEDLLDGLINYG